MHELPLVKSVFKSVMEFAEKNNAEKVTEVCLRIGMLRDFVPEYIDKYWKYVSSGTIASDAEIIIEDIPASVQCSRCGHVYAVDPGNILSAKCPECSSEGGRTLTGRELIIEQIVIKEKKPDE